MDIDLVALQCYVAVVENTSFSAAANKVRRSQSAVSQQIAKLEAILKKKLVNRADFQMTASGEVLYDYSKKMLRLYQEMVDSLSLPELKGELRFGLPEDFATVFLSNSLADFKLSHPDLFLQVECDLTLNLLKRFKQKEFDLVMIKTLDDEIMDDADEILSEKLVWVSSRNYLKDMDINQKLSLVLSPKPCIYRARVEEALDKAKFKWQVVYASPGYASKMAAVEAGLGITILPRNMIPDSLVEIKHSKFPNLKETHICFMINKKAPQSVYAFMEYIRKNIGAAPTVSTFSR